MMLIEKMKLRKIISLIMDQLIKMKKTKQKDKKQIKIQKKIKIFKKQIDKSRREFWMKATIMRKKKFWIKTQALYKEFSMND
jgi:hypothetical protein